MKLDLQYSIFNYTISNAVSILGKLKSRATSPPTIKSLRTNYYHFKFNETTNPKWQTTTLILKLNWRP